MRFLPAVLALLPAVAPAAAAPPESLWETAGFHAPESVVFDAARNQFYVSNMGTYGRAAVPDDGFISRVGPDGAILELKWITGLQDPKGLALAGGRLYVGDNAFLVEIDPAAGAVTARHEPADTRGDFNDCTADAAGAVYVMHGRLGTVYRLGDGRLEPWFKVDRSQTGWTNGLKALPDRLLLGGWTVRGPDGGEQPGHISFVTFSGPRLGRIGDQPLGRIDGLETDGRDGYTVTDWHTGNVLHVTADGKPSVLLALGQGAADHTYVPEAGLLVVPHVNDHKVRAYRWKP